MKVGHRQWINRNSDASLLGTGNRGLDLLERVNWRCYGRFIQVAFSMIKIEYEINIINNQTNIIFINPFQKKINRFSEVGNEFGVFGLSDSLARV